MRGVRLAGAIATGVLVALLRASTAQGQSAVKRSPPDSSAINEKLIDDGRAVFRGHGGCVVCHGQNLEGIVGPTLRAHKWKDAENGDYAAIIRVISNGVPGTVMVAHPNGVTDSQIAAVAAYVWAVSRNKAKP